MPSLISKIAKAEGCERTVNVYEDRCALAYDLAAMRLSKT